MHTMSNGRIRRTAQGWRDILECFHQNGLTVRQFCHQHSLALASFQRWSSRLASTSSLFVELEVPRTLVARNGESAVERPTQWIVEFVLPHGCILHIGA